MSQRLLPRADGKGRAVAAEILIVTPAVRDMIADGKRIGEIRDYIADGRDQYGMQTFDQHLADLVQDGDGDVRDGDGAATNPSDFELKMRMFTRRRRRRRRRRSPGPAEAGGVAGDRGFDFSQPSERRPRRAPAAPTRVAGVAPAP